MSPLKSEAPCDGVPSFVSTASPQQPATAERPPTPHSPSLSSLGAGAGDPGRAFDPYRRDGTSPEVAAPVAPALDDGVILEMKVRPPPPMSKPSYPLRGYALKTQTPRSSSLIGEWRAPNSAVP